MNWYRVSFDLGIPDNEVPTDLPDFLQWLLDPTASPNKTFDNVQLSRYPTPLTEESE